MMQSEEETIHHIVTKSELEEVRLKFQSDLVGLREQISLLQLRAAALESQLATIEPTVEARSSRTEKLVMELQLEVRKVTRALELRESAEVDRFLNIETMLKTLLKRTE